MHQEAVESEQQWDGEEEVDYYYPQTAKEDATFRAITTVHEIPYSGVDLSGGNDKDELSAEGSSLNPEADMFHPMRVLGDSKKMKETHLFREIHLLREMYLLRMIEESKVNQSKMNLWTETQLKLVKEMWRRKKMMIQLA